MYNPSNIDFERFAKYGTWWVNYISKEVKWSDGIFNIIGTEPMKIEFDKSAKVFHPNYRQLFINCSKDVFNGADRFDIELIAITKFGEKWVRAIGEPIFENNMRVGASGIIIDIDEYKKKEIELINNEATINAIISNTNAKIWATDTNYKYLSVNKAYQDLINDICGYYPRKGNHIFHAAIGADENKLFYDYYDRGLNGESFTVDSFYRRKGKVIHDILSFSPIINAGKITGVTIFSVDVTNEVKIEKEFKQQKLFFETILNSLNNEIWVINTDKKLVFANKSALQKYKYLFDIDFVPGMDALEMFVGPQEAFKDDWDNYYTEALTGKILNIKKKIPFGDDMKFYQFDFNPIYTTENNITGTVIIGSDTTFATRTSIVLEKAKEKAEEAAMLKSQYLSVMSHEVRTPLNAILGISNILLSESHTANQKEHLKTLKFSSEHLLTVVNDVLDYAKIDSGEIILENIEFNLTELITQINKTFLPRIEEKNLKYITNIDENIPNIYFGDPTRLSQVLINLISNAIKFTNKGKIELNIKLDSFSNESTALKFEIKDTGIGIPQNKIHDIFEPFKQSTSDTARKFGGTGLGLAICSRILSLQRSTFKIKSKVNEGTTFSFILVFNNSTKLELDNESIFIADNKKLEGYRILIAEDNSINQYILQSYLNTWGAKSDVAADGEEALKLIMRKEYDLILMDLQMPIMNGYEATKAIRNLADNYFKEIPIYALSAEVYTDVIDIVKISGMNEMIEKPFKPEKLLALITNNESFYQKRRIMDNSVNVYDIIDYTHLKEFIGEDENFLNEYLFMVSESLDEFKTSIGTLIQSKNHSQIKEILHKFKPTFTMLGNKKLMTTYAKIRNAEALDAMSENEIMELEKEIEKNLSDIQNEIKINRTKKN